MGEDRYEMFNRNIQEPESESPSGDDIASRRGPRGFEVSLGAVTRRVLLQWGKWWSTVQRQVHYLPCPSIHFLSVDDRLRRSLKASDRG